MICLLLHREASCRTAWVWTDVRGCQMTQPTGDIRSAEHCAEYEWPRRTRAVSHIGSACVVEGDIDFDLADLNLVRDQFPGQRVTLDGDVITVWPTPRTVSESTPSPGAPAAGRTAAPGFRTHGRGPA